MICLVVVRESEQTNSVCALVYFVDKHEGAENVNPPRVVQWETERLEAVWLFKNLGYLFAKGIFKQRVSGGFLPYVVCAIPAYV